MYQSGWAPADTGDGLVPFLIDWGSTPRPADTAPGGVVLVDLVLAQPEPGRVERARAALGPRREARSDGRSLVPTAGSHSPGGVLEL